MNPVEALRIALQSEIEAFETYQKMSIDYPEIKDICIELQNEEYKHRRMIENKIMELTRY